MGVTNQCECGRTLTKEEAEYKDKHPCLVFFCKIAQKRRREKREERRNARR